jgi:Xaa-Pro dipeptidase
VDAALCKKRIEKAQAQLKRSGADVLYVFSAVNILYFSGAPMGPSDRVVALLVPREGEPWLVVPGFEGARTEAAKPVGQVITWEEHEDPFALIAQTLTKNGLGSATLALDGETWFWVLEGLRAALPRAEFLNGEPLINRCRMIKSPEELALMEQACANTGKALAAAVAEFREGMTETEFGRLMADKYRTEAGVEAGALVQSGPRAADPHIPTGERPIVHGDAVVIDTGCRVEGFCSDVSRTLMVGRVPDEVAKAWVTLKDAQQAALDAIRPGATCGSIDAAARDWLDARGYGKYFVHRLGHGIGFAGHEYPYLVGGSDVVLEPGVTTTVEPGIYVPGRFGMRIEDVMVVTDDGCRLLSHMIPRDTNWAG